MFADNYLKGFLWWKFCTEKYYLLTVWWCRDGLMAVLISCGQKLRQRSLNHWLRFDQRPAFVQETCNESRLENERMSHCRRWLRLQLTSYCYSKITDFELISALKKIFAGFISLWYISLRWRKLTPSSICVRYFSTDSSGRGFSDLRLSASEPPSKYSMIIIRRMLFTSVTKPKNWMIFWWFSRLVTNLYSFSNTLASSL